MSQAAFGNMPYSATVRLWFDFGRGRVPLAQVGSTFIIPTEPREIPPCSGTVVISVDGREHRRDVRLVAGMSEDHAEAMVLADDSLPI